MMGGTLPEHPTCPECSSDVYVEGSKSNVYKYVCHICNVRFQHRDRQ